MWGPLVLAGDLGAESQRRGEEGEVLEPPAPVPVLIGAEREPASWVKPAGGTPVRFRTDGVGREPNAADSPHDVDLVPFYRLHRRRYAIYWDLFTPEEWEAQRKVYTAEAERVRRLEAATVAYLEPGEAVFEREYNYQAGDGATADRVEGRPGRRSRSWFSYDVPVDPDHPITLIATYHSGDRRGMPAAFALLIDGQVLREQELRLTDPPHFFDIEYPVPADATRGRTRVTLRLQAKDDGQIPTVFGLRLIRTDAER